MFGHSHQNTNELNKNIDLCMHCGSNIIRGAMRCVSCGKILKTPEEQSAAIREMTKSRSGFTIKKVIKIALVVIASGAAYYYSDIIQVFISSVLGK